MTEGKTGRGGYVTVAIVAIILGAFMQNTRAEDFGILLLGCGVLGLAGMAWKQ